MDLLMDWMWGVRKTEEIMGDRQVVSPGELSGQPCEGKDCDGEVGRGAGIDQELCLHHVRSQMPLHHLSGGDD